MEHAVGARSVPSTTTLRVQSAGLHKARLELLVDVCVIGVDSVGAVLPHHVDAALIGHHINVKCCVRTGVQWHMRAPCVSPGPPSDARVSSGHRVVDSE